MAIDIDQAAYLQSLEGACAEVGKAAQLGRELAQKGIKNVFFIGCGAPNREMGAIKYFLDRDAKQLESYLYFPAEFIDQVPAKLGADSLVVLASHSGTTPEIIQAAEFVKSYGCPTVGVTQLADSPLAQNVTYPFVYGQSAHGYPAKFMILLALMAGVMKEVEDWKLYQPVMDSLNCLPESLLDAVLASDARSVVEAATYKDDDFMMVMGAGPEYTTAYCLGICVLMEMQWMHTFVGESAEFFHGPFEVMDQNTPVLLLKGEGPSRAITERVERFCKRHTERIIVYDAKDFEMKGIHPEVREIVGHMVLSAATDRLCQRLAVWHAHPLSTRRYMWKSEY